MICPKCGMGYVPGFPDEEKEHRKYHDRVTNGLRAAQIKSDMVVWQKDNSRITVVNYFSPIAQKKRAEAVGFIAHKDTPFDSAPYHHKEPLDKRNVHLFLFSQKNRIIGLLLIEKRKFVKRFTWQDYENARGIELSKADPIWSIGLVWVHRKYRQHGLGSKLTQVAASYFDIGMQSIGWYTPFTDDGRKLVESLCPDSFLVAR